MKILIEVFSVGVQLGIRDSNATAQASSHGFPGRFDLVKTEQWNVKRL